MLFFPQLSEFVPLKNGFYRFRAQTDYYYLVDPGSYTAVVPRRVADLVYILSQPVAPVAYEVILEPGIGQFREFDPRQEHTRKSSWGLVLVHY